ncbi:Ase1/PRC1/MAP65 family protein [Marchantia polymorpha subsp. ruderalis]|uniref:Uncharacterized protein n=1 Tax=Marchantia polymorpha TaxID=3197 RepID=A0A2R6WR74_MARPO|nr:hypothetical protein MARPO_0064s0049 [Marchantia polymorpha]BBN18307.1 hypothetical protein Mp_8g01490 [Marchantia polymorpha subsp. ruderalis]|eukprot:PTQ36365.1 hypothetical protein MARPO_0064s0049 [Marchantia polymorpha]
MGQQQQQVDTTCGSLLRELQHIWDEVGESDAERDKMLLQLEQECLEVYRRKVDQASHARARLHQALADAEAELANLFSVLGDRPTQWEKRTGTLKEQVAAVAPQLEELRAKKEERARQFVEVKTQIQKIIGEISGTPVTDTASLNTVDADLTLRRLDEYHAQLQTLQKEKNDRLLQVLEYVNVVHELCAVLGMDFFKTITEVDPSLDDSTGGQLKSINNETLERLAKSIHLLQDEKKQRIQKLQDLGTTMLELWNLMDTPADEQQMFQHITCNIAASEYEVTAPGALTLDVIEQAEIEVERLDQLKASKMKELVQKKRTELEEICRRAHMEPDASTAPDKTNALIESGIVDPSELLGSLEEQIGKAREEAYSRREIMEKMEKWLAACEEESWLEDYNKDDNRYNASKGAHINLKRAERARATVNKLPSLVESLTSRTRAWEEERGTPFLYDGVRLLAMLDEYNFLRQEKEEEKRRARDQKRLQEQLMNEQEVLFGSRPSPNKGGMSAKKAGGGLRANGNGGTTQANRRLSLGGAMLQPSNPELLMPRVNGVTPSRLSSINGAKSGKLTQRPTAPLNYVAINKEDTASLASAGGSDPTSPQAG